MLVIVIFLIYMKLAIFVIYMCVHVYIYTHRHTHVYVYIEYVLQKLFQSKLSKETKFLYFTTKNKGNIRYMAR